MRALVQRVKSGSVTIDGNVHASIGRGFVVLLGVKVGDTPEETEFLADKCASLRIFEDEQGKMNLGLRDVDGSVLIVSQFTLYADAQKGNRPGFSEAARPEEAEPLYEIFVKRMTTVLGSEKVRTGMFRAMMDVNIVNDGPVTILIESKSS
jgi:D-aminoacyl-tRNA deacylase